MKQPKTTLEAFDNLARAWCYFVEIMFEQWRLFLATQLGALIGGIVYVFFIMT